jgi:hypothetical protein
LDDSSPPLAFSFRPLSFFAFLFRGPLHFEDVSYEFDACFKTKSLKLTQKNRELKGGQVIDASQGKITYQVPGGVVTDFRFEGWDFPVRIQVPSDCRIQAMARHFGARVFGVGPAEISFYDGFRRADPGEAVKAQSYTLTLNPGPPGAFVQTFSLSFEGGFFRYRLRLSRDATFQTVRECFAKIMKLIAFFVLIGEDDSFSAVSEDVVYEFEEFRVDLRRTFEFLVCGRPLTVSFDDYDPTDDIVKNVLLPICGRCDGVELLFNGESITISAILKCRRITQLLFVHSRTLYIV